MKAIDASNYRFLPMDDILVDTNFWLLVFDVFGSKDDRGYAELLDQITASHLYVTDLIISEFIHSTAKLAFKNYCEFTGHPDWNYKREYQKTDDYKKNYKLAIDTVKQDILKYATLLNTSTECVQKSLDKPKNMLDFNDRAIVQTALANHYKLLTDDADYANCNEHLTIITKNKNLLSLRKIN